MSDARPFTDAYKRYALAMMAVVVTFNYIDRTLITLLLQPIKEDLHLSDTQLGFLTGIAFGLFYATLGLPIARWADRGNRVSIASMAIGLWALTVMACVMVTNFVQLLLARIAAAVGEAGCMPPTYSLVGDYFPEPTERTRAMSNYMLGGPAATLVSFVLGGWLNEHYGWRVAFLGMGIPALLIAVLVKLTLVEPPRRNKVAAQDQPRMKDVLLLLWRQPSSRYLTLGIILFWTMSLGLLPWYAAFMMRSHGMGTGELGVWMGLSAGIGGVVGIWLCGHITARWFANDERRQMRFTAGILAALVPLFVLFLTVPQKQHALLAFIPLTTLFQSFYGPTFALMQRLVPDGMRATALAVVMLLANLIGMGIGPQIVGILSDLLLPRFGADSLRYAMLVMSLTALGAAGYFWRVGHTVGRDLSEAAA